MSFVGLNVNEGVTTGLSPVSVTSKYNIAMLFERERGIANVPVEITSLQSDRLRFGGVSSNKFGAYAARQLFKNAAGLGAVLYGVRILDVSNSVCASGEFGVTSGNTIPAPIFKVWAGQKSYKDYGSWANSLTDSSKGVRVKIYPKNSYLGLINKYLVQIFYNDVKVEEFSGSTWQSIITQANDASYYVLLEPQTLSGDITDVIDTFLSGGVYSSPTESLYYPVSDGSKKGLSSLDATELNLICCPELTTNSIATVGNSYCGSHNNRPLFIHCLPFNADSTAVTAFATANQSAGNNFIAAYNIWSKVYDEKGSTIWIPALGEIIGADYVRIPAIHNDQLFYPPAGTDGYFQEVLDVSPKNLTRDDQTLWSQRYSVNTATISKGKGTYVMTSRTCSTDDLYQSIHIRRMTSFYRNTMMNSLDYTTQKPITPELSREIYVSLYQFFLNEYNAGALEKFISFEKACAISVASSPQNRKKLVIKVDLIYTECSEVVSIELNRNDNALTLSN